MRRPPTSSLLISLMICLAPPAFAQQRPAPADSRATTPTTLTGKERLGEKWKDEQRIDNCKVPPERRGSKPRSSECPHVPST